jgi:uncharacterized membrane protein
MFDLPLHPIVVHFPIVLGMVLPFLGLFFWWAIKKEIVQQKAWILVTAVVLAYGAAAIIAVEVGEGDEEKVEEVISEERIEEHEEAGEMIPWIAGTLLIVSLAGMSRKRGQEIRMAFIVLSLAATVPLANAGHTGGELVYKYGAANAHLKGEQKALVTSGEFYSEHAGEHEGKEHDDDDD